MACEKESKFSEKKDSKTGNALSIGGLLISIIIDIYNYITSLNEPKFVIVAYSFLAVCIVHSIYTKNRSTLQIGVIVLVITIVVSHICVPEKSKSQSYADPEISVFPSISLDYVQASNSEVQFYADISGVDAVTPVVTWSITDSTGCSITPAGLFTTDGSPCDTVVTGNFIYKGETYSDSYTLSVRSQRKTVFDEDQSTEIRFFGTIPSGIDTSSSDFHKLTDCGIYDCRSDAEDGYELFECSEEKICGYVFYHWCRGSDVAKWYTSEDNYRDGHPHERKSKPEKSSDAYGNYSSFSCFYKDYEDIPFPLTNDSDWPGERFWMPNYTVCEDSYWYWMSPIFQCTITPGHIELQDISIVVN